MSVSSRYETRAVLAGAYKGKGARLDTTLTHVWDTVSGRVLCGRVNPDSLADILADDSTAPATCKTCARRDPRTHGILSLPPEKI